MTGFHSHYADLLDCSSDCVAGSYYSDNGFDADRNLTVARDSYDEDDDDDFANNSKPSRCR